MSNRFYNVLSKPDYDLPLYIISTGYWLNQHIVIRDHGWGAYQWLQCQGGQGVLELGGETVTISDGQGILLFPAVPHRYYALQEPWTMHWVEFNGALVLELLRALHFPETAVLYLTKPNTLLARVKEINTLFQIKKSIVPGHDSSQLMYDLLIDISRYTSRTGTDTKPYAYERLRPVMSLIESRYREPITLKDMADSLLVTPQYTCHIFRQALGMTPIEYLNRYRISKAKELLLEHADWGVKTVTLEVGFESPSYFIKIFRKNEGMTPLEFRRFHQSV
ncbi:AraC family transcriptional regulator [Paenibacillus ginsengarvi]|uniref:AraC family transcriptional regulator n=1 Tax=Paenibacillus ginsengarvi TaxID=400777 RepID=A0A3B0CFM9_9BACL|nr:AraC family transcriptional regulator [Paenibacillus ginsengarvi]RKN81936.1 AraC family transcriptional regulator [Paenibacillus ginsengarvi]